MACVLQQPSEKRPQRTWPWYSTNKPAAFWFFGWTMVTWKQSRGQQTSKEKDQSSYFPFSTSQAMKNRGASKMTFMPSSVLRLDTAGRRYMRRHAMASRQQPTRERILSDQMRPRKAPARLGSGCKHPSARRINERRTQLLLWVHMHKHTMLWHMLHTHASTWQKSSRRPLGITISSRLAAPSLPLPSPANQRTKQAAVMLCTFCPLGSANGRRIVDYATRSTNETTNGEPGD